MATLMMIYQPLTSNIHHTPTVSLFCVVTLLHLCTVFVQLLIDVCIYDHRCIIFALDLYDSLMKCSDQYRTQIIGKYQIYLMQRLFEL